jgi:hypothetical protein
MTRASDERYQVWKEKAEGVSLLAVAQMFGMKLKKHGQEFVGSCGYCAGRDRFAVNLTKGKWHCRGHGGGESPITLAMHVGNLAWKEAAEMLAGEPCPTGPVRPLSEAEQAERNRQRIKMEEDRKRREAQEAAYQEDTREAADRVWGETVSLDNTTGADYYGSRSIPKPPDGWPPSLRFHAALPYPGKGKYPAIVARVDDLSGNLAAVWRTYLRADGRKADVPNARLGLGPAGGGAVRIGGMGHKIGLAEGVESAMGAWNLVGRKFPVWAALSTSGLVGIEMPLGVEHVYIFPDGDRPLRKKGDEYEPAVPAGRKAALALRTRLLNEGISCTIAAEPGPAKDYADLWKLHAMEIA